MNHPSYLWDFETYLFFARKFDKRRRARHRAFVNGNRRWIQETRYATCASGAYTDFLWYSYFVCRYHSSGEVRQNAAHRMAGACATVVVRPFHLFCGTTTMRFYRRIVVITSKHRCQSAAEKSEQHNTNAGHSSPGYFYPATVRSETCSLTVDRRFGYFACRPLLFHDGWANCPAKTS